jgi:hypothetical protein
MKALQELAPSQIKLTAEEVIARGWYFLMPIDGGFHEVDAE